jgi:hypothetical protein
MSIENHELQIFKVPNGLFDVEPCEMDMNIGKRAKFLNPTCLIENDWFTIVGVQKNYQGIKCYRVVADSDKHKFGQVADSYKLEIFDFEK